MRELKVVVPSLWMHAITEAGEDEVNDNASQWIMR